MASSKKRFLGLVIVALLTMVGCSRPAPTRPPAVNDGGITGLRKGLPLVGEAVRYLPPNAYRKLLRDKARERHLSFHVYCTSLDGDWAYQGSAWPSNTKPLAPIEEGGKGFWYVHAHLQSDAIRMLYELLSDTDVPVSVGPDSEIARSKHEHKQCDPPFSGGPQ